MKPYFSHSLLRTLEGSLNWQTQKTKTKNISSDKNLFLIVFLRVPSSKSNFFNKVKYFDAVVVNVEFDQLFN